MYNNNNNRYKFNNNKSLYFTIIDLFIIELWPKWGSIIHFTDKLEITGLLLYIELQPMTRNIPFTNFPHNAMCSARKIKYVF